MSWRIRSSSNPLSGKLGADHCAFIRDHAPATASADTDGPSTDDQAALTVVATRNAANDGSANVIDLNQTQLDGANLDGALLEFADLGGADLTGAN